VPRCPGCNTLLTDVLQNDAHVKTCSNCYGIWISRQSLLHIVRTYELPEQSNQPNLQDLAAVVTESDSPRPLVCPGCNVKMRIDRLNPIIPVNLQFCDKCSQIWVDVGKLPLIQRLYFEFQRSTDPRILEIREKYALAQLSMEQTRERYNDLGQMAKRLNSPVSRYGMAGVNPLGALIGILSGR
jgi:Zn-finger nucleic acid-binding protein